MSDLDGFEVLPTFDQRTNKGKIGYRSKRIAELEERVSELESLVRDLYSYLESDYTPSYYEPFKERIRALGIEVVE